jgi:GntR family transcriptional repressor for pyruvate dehydrogenase complex
MKIVKTNVVEQVIDYIGNQIKNGQWKIGDKIPSENVLSKELEISRSSIRVALQQYIALGVLESQHGKGTFVINDDPEGTQKKNTMTEEDFRDIRKVLEFRRILESETCALAALNASEENIENLAFYLNKMQTGTDNPAVFIENDILYHEELAIASGNNLLAWSLKEVFEQTRKNHEQINDIFGFKDGIYFHTRILEAIKNKDEKKAKLLMHKHLQQAINQLK